MFILQVNAAKARLLHAAKVTESERAYIYIYLYTYIIIIYVYDM